MTRTLSVWVGAEIIYLYGTVNEEDTTFTLVGDGEWQAVVTRSTSDNYEIHLEAYSENGLEGTYDYTIYYGMLPAITDRTQADVNELRQLIRSIIRAGGWEYASPEDKARFLMPLKGAYNYTDLNRVGHNLDFLADSLNGYGYLVSVSPKTDWTLEDIPRASDMAQYLADLNALKDKFYGTTPLPASMDDLTHTDANNIEKLLLEIETYINRMVAGFRKCGTFKSGQGVILP